MDNYNRRSFFYDEKSENILFSFDECSCLELISYLAGGFKIKFKKFDGADLYDTHIYYGIEYVMHINSLEELENYLVKNDNVLIDDIEFVLVDYDILVSIHDDYEVYITCSLSYENISFIRNLIERMGYNNKIFDYLICNKGKYVFVEKEDKIIEIYDSFDDYIRDTTRN